MGQRQQRWTLVRGEQSLAAQRGFWPQLNCGHPACDSTGETPVPQFCHGLLG